MMNQLVSVDDKLNGKVYNYTYDAGGNLISETVTDSNGTTSNAYEYSNLNMIQTEFCIMSDTPWLTAVPSIHITTPIIPVAILSEFITEWVNSKRTMNMTLGAM